MSLTTLRASPGDPLPAASSAHRAGFVAALRSREAALVIGLMVAAFALRLPYLWSIPRFTDETREVLRAVELLSGGLSTADRLVNVDAYIGGLYLWLLAGVFWLTGVSALSPRLIMAVAGALAVGFTYLLARDLGGRLAGLVAAALLATSGGQILSNGHIAWSHCLTPTLTTLALWLMQRGVRDGNGPALLGSGFTFGLALQTHPATLVLLPGAAIYVLWWGRRLFRTPWPYLALLLCIVAFGNLIAYNLMTDGGTFREAATVRERYDRDITVNVLIYLGNHLTHGLMLLRYIAGAVDMRGPAGYLLDPTLWLYGGLALAGLVYAARKGAPLLLLVAISSIIVMPYFNQRKYVPISDGRYLMPLLPIAYAATAALLAALWQSIGSTPNAARWRAGAVIGLSLLVLYPLASLGRYYSQEVAAGRTNEPLLQAIDAVRAARLPDEAVLLDRDLADIKLEGGGTAFRSLRFLLAGVGIDDRSIDSVNDYAGKMTAGSSALLITDARGFQTFPRAWDRIAAQGVQAQAIIMPPGPDGFGAFRLTRGTSTAKTPMNDVADPLHASPGFAGSAAAGRLSLSTYSAPPGNEAPALGRSHTANGDGAVAANDPAEPVTVQQATEKSTVPVETWVTGLVNPRGLAFRSDGSLFVALAGSGGRDTVDVGRAKPHQYGRTGQVLRLERNGDKFLMAKNLPSIITAVNEECGPSAVAFIDDKAYLLLASGGWEIGDPAFHSGVYLIQTDGTIKLVWDMTAHVLANPGKARREDPRADVPAGMAYGMAAMGGKLYVTDANQEQLFEVDPTTGSARQVVEYPRSNRAMTGVAAGPDGAIYVAEWAANKITRITLDGKISDAATRLQFPVGVTFGPDGAMYVVEFTGRVLRAAAVGEQQKDIITEGLRAPTAIAFGPDGNLYVSVYGQGAADGQGQLVRLRLAPPDPNIERVQWANGAAWMSGILVFLTLLGIGWRFRHREPSTPKAA